MFRQALSIRRLVAAGTIAFVAVTPTSRVSAQTAIANFNTLTVTDGSGIRYINNCYTESGFTFTAVGVACGTPYTFATGGSADPSLYTGSPALFLNDPTATLVDFTRTDGNPFSLLSMGLAPFLGAQTSVTFSALLSGGSTVSQTATVPGTLAGVQTVALTGFTNVRSVRMTALNVFGEPIVQFDNVTASVVSVGVVPEPATVVLFAVGMLAIAVAARRRKSLL